MSRTMSLQQVLEIVRAHPGILPQAVASHLFCAAVSRATSEKASLRPQLVALDPQQGVILDLGSLPSSIAEADAGYVAPEALTGSAPPDDPRVLVYAAGALGYQLFTTEPPPPLPDRSRPELGSALGEIVRAALAPNPRERIPGLLEMSQALQTVLPSLGPALERQLAAAVIACCSRWQEDTAAGQLRAAAEAAEGSGAMPPPAQMARWLRELDLGLESQQRQRLDLVLALASGEPGGSMPRRVAPGEDRVARIGEQMQLLQRIVQLAPPPPASPLPAVPSLSALSWLRWAGSAVAGAAVALLAAQVIHSRRAPPSAPVETAGSEPLPDRSGDAPGTASAERTLVASPIVLSMPSGSGDGESSLEGRQQPPQATRGPATPRPPTPTPKLSTPKPPDASEDELLEKGEVALSLGRAAEALAAFRAVLDAHPDLPAAVRGVALAYLMQRRDAEAKAQLERYLELAPGADDAGRMRKIASGLVSNPPRR